MAKGQSPLFCYICTDDRADDPADYQDRRYAHSSYSNRHLAALFGLEPLLMLDLVVLLSIRSIYLPLVALDLQARDYRLLLGYHFRNSFLLSLQDYFVYRILQTGKGIQPG